MKKLLLGFMLVSSMSGFAEMEEDFDVLDFNYEKDLSSYMANTMTFHSNVSYTTAFGLSFVSPVAGLVSSSLVHCNLLATKHIELSRIENISTVQRRFELISACLVGVPLNSTTNAVIGSFNGVDGQSDVLAYIQIQQEAIAQLEQAAEGSEELALAKVMIDGYLLDKNAPDMKRSEAAEKILSEITLDV